mgnify:CR=1 FL=1|jgi:hypothetical protein
MKASDFEEKVWTIEGVRIVLRIAPNTEVGEYTYKKAADESWRITELGSKRIEKSIGTDIPYTVIQGNGEEPNGKVILRTLRNGYQT